MRKRILILVMCLGLTVSSISGCASAKQNQQKVTKKESQEISVEQKKDSQKEEWVENPIPEMPENEEPPVQARFSDDEIDKYINYAIKAAEPLNLTMEQKLEDYDFMWNTIKEKVYCIEEIAASKGMNLQEHISKWRKKAAETSNDAQFWRTLWGATREFTMDWHIGIPTPRHCLEFATLFGERNAVIKRVSTEENLKLFKYWDYTLKKNDCTYNVSMPNVSKAEVNMIQLEILNDTTALIKVPTMQYEAEYDKAAERIIELMKEVSEYENVILDLQGNSGGNTAFWMDNIVAPNIDEKLEVSNVKLYKDTEDIQDLINKEQKEPQKGYSSTWVRTVSYPDRPLSEMPEELKIAGGKYGNADTYSRWDMIFHPRYTEKILKGKLWVLTYPENYSASEAFAAVCKKTGFATLVGRQTGGDGLAMGMPLWYTLPNSHLVGICSYQWALNEDGTNNTNEGTRPDIESPAGETPLETCLRAIAKEE